MASKGSGMRVVIYDESARLHTSISSSVLELVESFQHLESCVSFIEQNAKDERLTILITTSIDDQVLQTFETIHSVESILILSKSKRVVDTCPSKVTGIYHDIEHLLRALFETLDIIEVQLNANSMLFHQKRDGSDNINFYFFNIWRTHYITPAATKRMLVDEAYVLFHSETNVKYFIHDFNSNYKPSEVLHWINKYKHPFPYHLLVSNAIRTHDQQMLYLVRFFIFDLVKQMKYLPTGPSYNQVFLGTKLPISLVDRLEHRTSQDIITFQCFLSVTRSRTAALSAAIRPCRRRKVASVLFKIDISHALCANFNDSILVDLATPFRVTRVARNTGFGGVQQLVTVVTLIALDQKHREELFGQFVLRQKGLGRTLHDFLNNTIPLVRPENTHQRKIENKSNLSQYSIPLYVVAVSEAERDYLAVCDEEIEADELIARGAWAQAVDALARIENPNVRVLNKQGCLLRERLQDIPGALECHEQALLKATDKGKAETLIYMGICYHEIKDYSEALRYFNQALSWFQTQNVKDPSMMARCFVGMGNAHWARRELDEALDYSKRALALRERDVVPRNDFEIAACLGNIGNILHDQGEIKEALEYAMRAADLLSKCGKHDLRLAAALNNLGAMYQSAGINDKAVEYFQLALESLPNENHPYRTKIINNITRLNERMKPRE